MNNIFCALLSFYNRPSTVILQQAWPIILATFTDAFKLSGQSRKCIVCRGYIDIPCRTDRSFSSLGFRDGSMVAPNAAECCNSIDRPGKWIPNGGRHCERRGQNYQSCNGNGMSWKPAATGERKIHSQRQKVPDEGRERK